MTSPLSPLDRSPLSPYISKNPHSLEFLAPNIGKSAAMLHIMANTPSAIMLIDSEGVMATSLMEKQFAQHQAHEERNDLEAQTVAAHSPPALRRI